MRALGIGYRASYIKQSAELLVKLGGKDWLTSLRSESRLSVQSQLMQLQGVGRKVADCVALFSLDQSAALPVDTHVWDIAVRDYDPTLASRKSLTPAVYEAVGDLFRSRFGSYAGWAHSLLFAAELPQFRSMLPADAREEMERYEKVRRELSKEKKRVKQERNAKVIEGEGDLGSTEDSVVGTSQCDYDVSYVHEADAQEHAAEALASQPKKRARRKGS